MRWIFVLAVLPLAFTGAPPALAQVPVLDSANLAKAQQIATSTQQILTADQQILQFTQKTLQAVTGDRSSQAQARWPRWRSAAASRWRRRLLSVR